MMRAGIGLRIGLMMLCAAASAAPSKHPFEAAWDEWAKLANERAMHPDTIDAREVLAWARLKSQFRKLEKQMDAMYRGDR